MSDIRIPSVSQICIDLALHGWEGPSSSYICCEGEGDGGLVEGKRREVEGGRRKKDKGEMDRSGCVINTIDS